jgi:SAM-dependent methyltransferase
MSDREYWDAYARAFDTIYSHKKNRIGAWLDRMLRKDMYERFEFALAGAEPIKGRTFLDIGCGSGVYVKALAERGAARVVGLDFSPEMFALAKENIAAGAGLRRAVKFVCADFMEYEPSETFDVVLGMGFMDYVADPPPVLKKMRALAKDKVLLSFPRAGTWRAAARNLRMKLRPGRKLRGCQVYFYSEARIARLMREAGFKDFRRGRVGQLCYVDGL